MSTTQSERRVGVYVDLAGSNCGPEFRNVDLILAPGDWDDERVRSEAAKFYAVPLEQVGRPRIVIPYEEGDDQTQVCLEGDHDECMWAACACACHVKEVDRAA